MIHQLKVFSTQLIIIIPIFFCSVFVQANEIYLLKGYQGGGEFEGDAGEKFKLDEDDALGVALNIDLDKRRELEFSYSRQSTSLLDKSTNPSSSLFDVDIDYLQMGGTVLIEDNSGWRSFLLGGFGLTHFSPSGGFDSETKFSLSLGLGLKKQLSRRLMLRADARVYGTFFDSGSSIFCSNGNCLIRVESSIETQYQINIGLGYKF